MLLLMRMRWLALGVLVTLAACGDQSRRSAIPASVPEEFRQACGNPGSTVTTERSAVVVRHADCDLTGVTIRNGSGGATVPKRGEGVAGSGSNGTVTVQVDGVTGDVTFRASP